MEKSEIQQQCSKCGYKQDIPGDTHISCLFDWGKEANRKGAIIIHPPRGHVHGMMNGWYNFPFSYGPVWMLEQCSAFSKEADPEKKAKGDVFARLIALLGRK